MKEVLLVKGRLVRRMTKLAAPVGAGLVSALSMCPVAFATEGGGSDSGMTAILGSMATLTSLMSSVWQVMTANPLLTVFLAASLLTVGISIFKRIKRAAK